MPSHLITQQLCAAAAAEILPLLLLLLLLVVEMMMVVARDVILLRCCRRSSARSCAGEDANAENMCFYVCVCVFTRASWGSELCDLCSLVLCDLTTKKMRHGSFRRKIFNFAEKNGAGTKYKNKDKENNSTHNVLCYV